mgnify:CR=1 FL=1
MAKTSVETAERHPRGGMYFEDLTPGLLYEHRLRRTVTQMDNMLFSNMTLNPQPLHIDAHFCATETEWGRPLMNSMFTLEALGLPAGNELIEDDSQAIARVWRRFHQRVADTPQALNDMASRKVTGKIVIHPRK